jgi:hypothetical protein
MVKKFVFFISNLFMKKKNLEIYKSYNLLEWKLFFYGCLFNNKLLILYSFKVKLTLLWN